FRFGKPVTTDEHAEPPMLAGNVSVVSAVQTAPPPARTLVHLGLTDDDFRTQSRAKLTELLHEVSRKQLPAAGQEEINARLDDAFSGTQYAEEGDGRELSEWARSHLGLEVPADELTDLTREEAQDVLWNAFDDRYRPEMKRMERSLLLSQLDTSW